MPVEVPYILDGTTPHIPHLPPCHPLSPASSMCRKVLFAQMESKVPYQSESKRLSCVEMATSSSSESISEGVVASGTAQTQCAMDHP